MTNASATVDSLDKFLAALKDVSDRYQNTLMDRFTIEELKREYVSVWLNAKMSNKNTWPWNMNVEISVYGNNDLDVHFTWKRQGSLVSTTDVRSVFEDPTFMSFGVFGCFGS